MVGDGRNEKVSGGIKVCGSDPAVVNADGIDRDRTDAYLSADAVPMVVFLLCQFRGLAIWTPDGLGFFPVDAIARQRRKKGSGLAGKVEK